MCIGYFFLFASRLIFVFILLYINAGAKCVGDFNYYLSFTIMFGLPVGIVVVGLGMYCYKVRMITHKLHTMSVEEKAETKKDAFHQLFRIVSILFRINLFH